MSLALVIGLGARLLLHKLNGSQPVDTNSFLIERLAAGLWQGAAVHLALIYSPRLALGITIGVAVRVGVALLQVYIGRSDNPVALAASLLGLAFGVLAADVADALVERISTWGAPTKKRRTLSRRRSVGVPPREQVQLTSPTPSSPHPVSANGHASHSRQDVSSPEPGSGATTPANGVLQVSNIAALENELAELQAKAAEAAAQKARFSEERAWALDARNFSWASQLAWQIQRCDVLERSYASAARQKMRELENLNFAVHVDIFGRSYLDDVLVHIEDRLVEARALGKSRLRVALSGPREQVDNEIKPLVRNHFKGMKRHVLQDPVDPTILYIDVDPWPVEDESATTGVKSDDWSRALD